MQFFYMLSVEKHNDNAKRAYFSSNKWNASMTLSEQKPGLTAYESMLHQKGITPSTMMNTGSMEAFRL